MESGFAHNDVLALQVRIDRRPDRGDVRIRGDETMSLSVLMPGKISEELLESVDMYLRKKGFYREESHYCSHDEAMKLTVCIVSEPEKDAFWIHGPIEVVWFIPMTEIVLESRYTAESHDAGYRMARELAQMVRGVIFDHMVAVVYNSEGEPFHKLGIDGEYLPAYGTGPTRAKVL